MSYPLRGKVVFITGGARGIGAAVGTEAARRGARVTLTGLEPDELAATAAGLGEGHLHLEADVTDAGSIQRAVAATVSELGGVDVVVANAGIATYGTAEKGDPDSWLRTIDINLNGVFRTVHATLPQVLERQGFISIVASVASFAPLAGMSSYTASKAGVESFARALRQEVGFRGVGVNTVHPSWIDTDLVREAAADLPSYREMRSRLPWPVKATTSVEACARAIVDGIEARRARVFVPRSVALLHWIRALTGSAVGERAMSREVAEMVPRMERDVAALGRSSSERTTAINELPSGSEHEAEAPGGAGSPPDREQSGAV
jgi:NAD(P)-dependent dehydrogenase (short-subunit alcohol dehydrogenase family)